MDILDTKSEYELIQSLLAETAKAKNELECARNDLDKIRSRLSFNIAVINNLLQRPRIKR